MAEIITVHRLWPEEEPPLDYNPVLTIIFFHGLQIRRGDRAWESTWIQGGLEGRLVCWPREWLPQDLEDGENKVVVYSLAYDADAIRWQGRGQTDDVEDIGKDLIQKLVASTSWGLVLNRSQCIALVGHSFGRLVLKSLVVEAKKQATLLKGGRRRNDIAQRTSEACKSFLEKVELAVFYSTPHSGADSVKSAQKLQKITKLPLLSGILKNIQPFERAMENLSVAFEDAAREDISIYAFAEGRPIRIFLGLKSVLVVPYASAMRLSSNNHMKVEDADHFEVCKPPHKGHVSYTKLLELLRMIRDTHVVDDLR